MRTTLQIDDNLMVQAKKLAAETGRTLTALIEDALREALARTIQASRLSYRHSTWDRRCQASI